MNTLSILKLQNYETKETLNLINGVCVLRSIDVSFEDTSTTHSIKNASFYNYSEVLNPYVIELTFYNDYEHDYNIKRFINTQNALFLLYVTQNDRQYTIFCRKGVQNSPLDTIIKKEYDVTLVGVSRFFETILLNPSIGINENSRYQVGKYEQNVYQGTDINIEATVQFLNDGDTSSYLQIEGYGNGNIFELYVNKELKTYTTTQIRVNDELFYSNIPTQKTLIVDEERRIDLLPIDNINFEYEIPVGVNVIEVRGLTDIKLTLLKGVNII